MGNILTLIKTPRRQLTEQAIYMAHAGAKKMDAQGYRYEMSRYMSGSATITNPAGKRYRTHVPLKRTDWPAFCNCPQATAEGICKHQVWLGDKIAEDREADRQADEMAENLANVDEWFGVDKIGM